MGKSIERAITAAPLLLVCSILSPGLAAAADDVYVVKQAEGLPTVSVGGTVIPYKEVTMAAQLPGRVKYLAGIEGDSFKDGDLLVAIDDTELMA